MRPQEIRLPQGFRKKSIAIEMEGISLIPLLHFLYGIEEARPSVFVRRLELKKNFERPQFLDVSITVEAIEKKS